jgi:hypothetical protein
MFIQLVQSLQLVLLEKTVQLEVLEVVHHLRLQEPEVLEVLLVQVELEEQLIAEDLLE